MLDLLTLRFYQWDISDLNQRSFMGVITQDPGGELAEQWVEGKEMKAVRGVARREAKIQERFCFVFFNRKKKKKRMFKTIEGPIQRKKKIEKDI